MVMFARTVALCIACLLLGAASGRAIEDCGPGDVGTDSDAIFRGLTPSADWEFWRHPCKDVQCEAAHDLACAYEALTDIAHPNSMGRLDGPAGYYRDLPGYKAVVRSLGRKHPERRELYCDMLAKVAELDTDTIPGNIAVTLWTTELATRITRPGFDCIGRVMAAYPRTRDMQTVVAYAKGYCVLSKRLCDRIVLPAPDSPDRAR
jgi:hypothetical protein